MQDTFYNKSSYKFHVINDTLNLILKYLTKYGSIAHLESEPTIKSRFMLLF